MTLEDGPLTTRGTIEGAPEPPYYAVVFTSRRPVGVDDGYDEMGEEMFELASQQPGYLGADTTRGPDGLGITVSYWKDEESIAQWHRNAEHGVAQRMGYETFYERFSIRVARVERQYGFTRDV